MEITKEEALERLQNWHADQSPIMATGYVKNTRFVFAFTGVVQIIEGVIMLYHDEDTAMTVPVDDAVLFEYLEGENVIAPKPEEGPAREFEGGVILHAAEDKWSCSIMEMKQQ